MFATFRRSRDDPGTEGCGALRLPPDANHQDAGGRRATIRPLPPLELDPAHPISSNRSGQQVAPVTWTSTVGSSVSISTLAQLPSELLRRLHLRRNNHCAVRHLAPPRTRPSRRLSPTSTAGARLLKTHAASHKPSATYFLSVRRSSWAQSEKYRRAIDLPDETADRCCHICSASSHSSHLFASERNLAAAPRAATAMENFS